MFDEITTLRQQVEDLQRKIKETEDDLIIANENFSTVVGENLDLQRQVDEVMPLQEIINELRPYAQEMVNDLAADIQEGGSGKGLGMWNTIVALAEQPNPPESKDEG